MYCTQDIQNALLVKTFRLFLHYRERKPNEKLNARLLFCVYNSTELEIVISSPLPN